MMKPIYGQPCQSRTIDETYILVYSEHLNTHTFIFSDYHFSQY